MKLRIFSLIMAVAMLFSLIPLAGAANNETSIVETIDLGDGFTVQVTSASRCNQGSTKAATPASYTKRGFVSQNGKQIGVFTLCGEFSYNGITSSATNHNWSANASSGYDYDGNSYISGSSVRGSCTFTGNGYSKTVSLKITCDKNGNIS